jgi:hypothetical protein
MFFVLWTKSLAIGIYRQEGRLREQANTFPAGEMLIQSPPGFSPAPDSPPIVSRLKKASRIYTGTVEDVVAGVAGRTTIRGICD